MWLKENAADFDRRQKELQVNIGGISNSNGFVVEDAIYAAIEKDMIFANIKFDFIERNKSRHIKSIQKKGEYDIVLVNGTMIAILEAKHKVKVEDVEKLATNKIKNFRLLFPEFSNHKIILGIAGMGYEKNAYDKANEKGVIPIRVLSKKIEYNTDCMKTF